MVMPTMLNDQQLADYSENGFLVVDHLFDEEEADLLQKVALADQPLAEQATAAADSFVDAAVAASSSLILLDSSFTSLFDDTVDSTSGQALSRR